jgi:GNAT superfamily N-acetyltransferase
VLNIAQRVIMGLHFRPLDDAGARHVAGWRYESPYSIYQIELQGDLLERGIAFLIDPMNCYYRIDNAHGELVAFCCYGEDAQVEGGNYSSAALDIGMGVHPELTGQGRGHVYALATATFGIQSFQPNALRVTIAGFNVRAQRVWQKLGFAAAQEFRSPMLQSFIIFTRSVEGLHVYSE